MTIRERMALTLVLGGVVAGAIAGYGFGGWPLLAAVVAVMLVALGLLLGFAPEGDPDPTPEWLERLDELDDRFLQLAAFVQFDPSLIEVAETDEDGVQRG